ncbi:hypothetical protein [Streptomyces sp. AC495_CC817]|uniref:hypothetical protein n=1 Tax=Streptomyces sp. AC495_CC817 TaxID=2823900 RepID=UPI001C274C3A|nr:hypothetical protein [Streptomyces sp. AC495_CC817]
MTTLLAVDPGVSTGWSVWTYDAVTPLRVIEHGTVKNGLRGFLDWFDSPAGDLDEIVAEDFILDGRTAQPDTTPLEILGALEALVWPTCVPLIRQRNFMKAHAPDPLLKEKGLWWPGAGHDRDSARHALALLKTRRHAPTLAWLYGRKDAA